MMYFLANLKSQIKISAMASTITLYTTKYDLPHEIFFDDSRPSHVIWAEKKVFWKNSLCIHMLRDSCPPALDNPTNEVSLLNKADTALDSIKSGSELVMIKTPVPNLNTFAAAGALGVWSSTLSSERPKKVQGSLVESMCPGYSQLVQKAPQNSEAPVSHCRTSGT